MMVSEVHLPKNVSRQLPENQRFSICVTRAQFYHVYPPSTESESTPTLPPPSQMPQPLPPQFPQSVFATRPYQAAPPTVYRESDGAFLATSAEMQRRVTACNAFVPLPLLPFRVPAAKRALSEVLAATRRSVSALLLAKEQ